MNAKMIDRLNFLTVFDYIDPEDFEEITIAPDKIICLSILPIHPDRLTRYPLLKETALGWLCSSQQIESGHGDWTLEISIMK